MMRQKSLLIAAAIALLVLLAWGCGEDPTCVGDCPRPSPGYLPQTSPVNVINNLEASWMRREIEQYAKLLAPDFHFYFLQSDIPADLPRDYWTRDEDSTGTSVLFSTTAVLRVQVDLGAFTVEDSIRVDQPDVKRVRLAHAKLEVELRAGTTWQVEDVIEEFYFRKGRSEEGTDPTLWYIVEWHEYPARGSLKPTRGALDSTSDLAESRQLAQTGSWGLFKQLYR